MTLGVREGSSSLRKVCLVAKSKCPMLLMLMKPLYISLHGTPFSSEPWAQLFEGRLALTQG